MRRVFVDTSGWFDLVIPGDPASADDSPLP